MYTTIDNIFSYQMSTIQCMYHSLDLTCGKEKADLALAPALEEAHLAKYTDPPPTTTARVNETFLDENGTLHENFHEKPVEFGQVLNFNGSNRTVHLNNHLSLVFFILFHSLLIKHFL